MTLSDLKPGDRIILRYESARSAPEREAEFRGVFPSLQAALNHSGENPLVIDTGAASDYLNMKVNKPWAAFLFETSTAPVMTFRKPDGARVSHLNPMGRPVRLFAAFQVKDGEMIDEEHRPITILRRVEVLKG